MISMLINYGDVCTFDGQFVLNVNRVAMDRIANPDNVVKVSDGFTVLRNFENIDVSMYQRSGVSTDLLFDLSTYRILDVSTYRCIDVST